jgi:hypothetical protein
MNRLLDRCKEIHYGASLLERAVVVEDLAENCCDWAKGQF